LIEVRNDNEKDVGGVRIMNLCMVMRVPSLHKRALLMAQILPSRIMEPGFARKNKGPQILCPNLQKVDY